MNFLLLIIFALTTFQQQSDTSTPAPLSLEVDGRSLTFVSFENGVVTFQTKTLKFSELPFDAKKLIMEHTGWGRVWEDRKGTHHTIADLVEVVENAVVLEKTSGERIVVAIDKLSTSDSAYAESRRKLSGALPDQFVAKVVAISDGDTLTVLLNRRQYKVRISGIDAPEKSQDFGTKSKEHLGALVHGKFVRGTRESTDQYGRNICELTVGENRVDHAMLSAGLAWHYVNFSDDEVRAEKENIAKKEGLNIWSESGPVAPWEWRKWGADKRKQWLTNKSELKAPEHPMPDDAFAAMERMNRKRREAATAAAIEKKKAELAAAAKAIQDAKDAEAKKIAEIEHAKHARELAAKEREAQKADAALAAARRAAEMQKERNAKTHWLNTHNNIRHNSGCRWFNNTKEGRRCTSHEGKGCEKCGG